MNVSNFFIETQKLFSTLKATLVLAWKTDAKLTASYYLSAGMVALIPLFSALALKYLIDGLNSHQGLGISVPVILILVLGGYYFVDLIGTIARWGGFYSYFDYLLRYRLQNQLSLLFYEKTASLDIQHLEDPQTQNLLTKAKETFNWRVPDFLRVFSYIFTDLISVISSAVVLATFGWWIPIVVLVIALPRFVMRVKQGSIQWSIYGSSAPETRMLWYFSGLFTQINSIRETRIFRSQRTLLDKYQGIQDHLYRINKKPLDNFIKVMMVLPLFEVGLLFGIAYLFLPEVVGGVMSVGTFAFFISILNQMNGATSGIGGNLGEFYENKLYASYFFEVMALPSLITEDQDPISLDNSKPPRIEFVNVSFAYPNGHVVLKDVSFTINPGESLAMVGVNGAGKSTIVKLLCRFYDVTDGQILINGINIKKLKLANWYTFLGTLFQDFVQYHFTVRENIMLGDPKKKNERQVMEAAMKAGADEFIQKLPNKYDQMLGREFENGEELSGGQWQKLAIARAFYHSPPLLIMDEPTSAIDAQAEYEIFNNLEREYKDKTLILVSHRFSTVRNANKIIVIVDGEISEQGTHEQLLAKNGQYAKMFKVQAKGYK